MKKLLGITFQAGLRLNAALTRLPRLRAVEGRLLTPMFVRLTRVIRGAPAPAAASTLEGLGREWERLLGNRVYARVTAIDRESQTVYGEISGLCPLRNSGDLAACHRLMAYDRGLMAPYGVSFVVLASQAEPGRNTCRIAMRPAGVSTHDLVPAHRLTRAKASAGLG